jgi:single-strand DNA-binding protein
MRGGEKMNIGTFAGHVGADAEVTTTRDGKSVASFRIAIDRGKDGERKLDPLWIKAVLWEKRAENLAPYIKKGLMVVVSGPVSVEAWLSAQSPSAQAMIVVTVREFTFGGGGAEGKK